jgi:uncharacterized protein (TIGR02466 family)
VRQVDRLFATLVCRTALADDALVRDLAAACRSVAADDAAGQAWSRAHAYQGYTSYASLNDLAWRMPAFAALERALDPLVAAFARDLAFDLARRKLRANALWVNVLEPGGAHSGHIHPQSVISGTVYIDVPPGASALRFEDPRLAMMMHAPQRKQTARRDQQSFITVAPAAGDVVLWESWLRHEVTPNAADRARISVSFNYD